MFAKASITLSSALRVAQIYKLAFQLRMKRMHADEKNRHVFLEISSLRANNILHSLEGSLRRTFFTAR
ncbi:hypothetical protein ACHAPJ_001151 [Fusarium lateritium]